MRDFLIFLPLTLLFLAIRSTLFDGIPLPDLPLLIVFYLAYTRASISGVVLSFVLGFIDDVFNAAVIGSTSFSLVLVFAATYLLGKKFHFSTTTMIITGGGVMALIKVILTYVILGLFNLHVDLLVNTLPQIILTGLFAPAIIAVISRLGLLATPPGLRGPIQ
jgi:rod shape-determining protein MreD